MGLGSGTACKASTGGEREFWRSCSVKGSIKGPKGISAAHTRCVCAWKGSRVLLGIGGCLGILQGGKTPAPVFHVRPVSLNLCTEGGQGRRGNNSCAAKPAWVIWLCFSAKHLLVPGLIARPSVWYGDYSSGWRWRKLQALAWGWLHVASLLSAPTPGIPAAAWVSRASYRMRLCVQKSSMHEKNTRLANIYMLCSYKRSQCISTCATLIF